MRGFAYERLCSSMYTPQSTEVVCMQHFSRPTSKHHDCARCRKYLQIIADLQAAARVSTPCQMLKLAVQIDGYRQYLKVNSLPWHCIPRYAPQQSLLCCSVLTRRASAFVHGSILMSLKDDINSSQGKKVKDAQKEPDNDSEDSEWWKSAPVTPEIVRERPTASAADAKPRKAPVLGRGR